MNKLPEIPYFTTSRYRVRTMIRLAALQIGEFAVDLGSGDGRIVIALAQAGAVAYGFETQKALRKQSQKTITTLGLTHAFILDNNFWQEDVSRFAIITFYGMPDIMLSLKEKLLRETKPGTRILSNYYPLPGWKETTKEDNIYLYVT